MVHREAHTLQLAAAQRHVLQTRTTAVTSLAALATSVLADADAAADAATIANGTIQHVIAGRSGVGPGQQAEQGAQQVLRQPAHYPEAIAAATVGRATDQLGKAPLRGEHRAQVGQLGRHVQVRRATGHAHEAQPGQAAPTAPGHAHARRSGCRLATGCEQGLVPRLCHGVCAVDRAVYCGQRGVRSERGCGVGGAELHQVAHQAGGVVVQQQRRPRHQPAHRVSHQQHLCAALPQAHPVALV
mmetsp:Transcript_14023/g.31004  ORF Transcript_14023/g.31004 Transcript_14023/m.31004 type:complete len:243 (+) Transcript_14023:1918-2646(+)